MRKALTILTALVAIFTLTATAFAVAPRHNGKDCGKNAFVVSEYQGAKGGDTQAIKLTIKIKVIPGGPTKDDTLVYTVTGKTTKKSFVFCPKGGLYDRKGLGPWHLAKKVKLSKSKRSFKLTYERTGKPPMQTRVWAKVK